MQDLHRIHNEIGIGNASFINCEIEEGENEHRVPYWVPLNCNEIYFRLWIGKKVFILSSKNGFHMQKKSKSRFKCLVGFSGPPKS